LGPPWCSGCHTRRAVSAHRWCGIPNTRASPGTVAVPGGFHGHPVALPVLKPGCQSVPVRLGEPPEPVLQRWACQVSPSPIGSSLPSTSVGSSPPPSPAVPSPPQRGVSVSSTQSWLRSSTPVLQRPQVVVATCSRDVSQDVSADSTASRSVPPSGCPFRSKSTGKALCSALQMQAHEIAGLEEQIQSMWQSLPRTQDNGRRDFTSPRTATPSQTLSPRSEPDVESAVLMDSSVRTLTKLDCETPFELSDSSKAPSILSGDRSSRSSAQASSSGGEQELVVEMLSTEDTATVPVNQSWDYPLSKEEKQLRLTHLFDQELTAVVEEYNNLVRRVSVDGAQPRHLRCSSMEPKLSRCSSMGRQHSRCNLGRLQRCASLGPQPCGSSRRFDGSPCGTDQSELHGVQQLKSMCSSMEPKLSRCSSMGRQHSRCNLGVLKRCASLGPQPCGAPRELQEVQQLKNMCRLAQHQHCRESHVLDVAKVEEAMQLLGAAHESDDSSVETSQCTARIQVSEICSS